MPKRFITTPEDSVFLDPITMEPLKGSDGKPLPPRSHQWFMHTFVLSHPIFGIANGYDAVAAAKSIAKAIDDEEPGSAYAVSADQLRMIHKTIAKAAKEGEGLKMSNYEAMTLFDQMDALMNASTKDPLGE